MSEKPAPTMREGSADKGLSDVAARHARRAVADGAMRREMVDADQDLGRIVEIRRDRDTRLTSAPAARTGIDQGLPMARKAFVVNEAVCEKVRHLAGIGVRQDDIASIGQCSTRSAGRMRVEPVLL